MDSIKALIAQPIAHRGLHDGNKDVPENTLAACLAAADAGYGIEIDVQLSEDDVPVVFHDSSLERLCGRANLVEDLSAATLATIPVAGTMETILPLETVLANIAGRVPIVVEMKDNGSRNPTLAHAVAEVVNASSGPLAAMSFNYDLVSEFVKYSRDVPAGLTAEGTDQTVLGRHQAFADSDPGRQIKFISYNAMHLPNGFVDAMRERRTLPIITWTIRTPGMRAQVDKHADQITFEGFRA